jgi:branched-chain amino acid transport system permease protein
MAAGATMQHPLRRRLIDAALAGLVTLVLAVPLIGLETIDQPGGLGIGTRWDWVAWAVGLVFLGRLVLADLAAGAAKLMAAGPSVKLPPNSMLIVSVAAVVFAFAMPQMEFADRRVVDLGTTVLIYVMLGWGLNIVIGLAGLLDLGYVAFYAVGAYSYTLLALHLGWGFWECLPLAGAFAALFGVLLGFPVLRLRGDYLAIVTLGFGEMIKIILVNWQPVTGGPNGLSGIPRPGFFGLEFTANPREGVTSFADYFGIEFSSQHRLIFLYYVILVLALITNAFALRLRKLPVGRAWEALREDEIASRALGINPTNTKLTAFGIGAMLGGFAGAFFATRQGFISPESFTFTESATIVAIVVLGGLGSQAGVVAAALFLVLIPELGRDFAQYRMLLFGLAMIGIMIWRPTGLIGHRNPTVRLGPREAAAASRS